MLKNESEVCFMEAFIADPTRLIAAALSGLVILLFLIIKGKLQPLIAILISALCNGLISALISFTRSLLLRGGMVLLLPLLWGMDGIWWAVVVAEGLGACVSLAFLITQRRRYRYA